jgi:hypothetical protein
MTMIKPLEVSESSERLLPGLMPGDISYAQSKQKEVIQ